MSNNIRLTSGLILFALVTAPLAVRAHDDDHSSTSVAESTSSKMIVVRDAETGKLRAATGEEINAMQAKEARLASLRRVASATPLQKFHVSGAQGARLTEEFMSQSVAVRAANGKLLTKCLESKEEADAFIQRHAAPANQTVTE